MPQAPTFVSYTPILAARADEFEHWLATVVFPAMDKQRPDQAGRVGVFRTIHGAEDGVVMFTIFFHGGELADWNIKPFLSEAIGDEAADRELEKMQEMCPEGQTSYTLTLIPEDVAAAAWAEDNTSSGSSWPAASTAR